MIFKRQILACLSYLSSLETEGINQQHTGVQQTHTNLSPIFTYKHAQGRAQGGVVAKGAAASPFDQNICLFQTESFDLKKLNVLSLILTEIGFFKHITLLLHRRQEVLFAPTIGGAFTNESSYSLHILKWLKTQRNPGGSHNERISFLPTQAA